MGLCASSPINNLVEEHTVQPQRQRSHSLPNKEFVPTVSQDLEKPESTENIWEFYTKIEVLGQGAYGKVYGVERQQDGYPFAMKRITRKKKWGVKAFHNEMKVLGKLDHPNIIKVQRTWKDDKFFYCIMKLCEGGSILDKVKRDKFLSEKLVAEIMLDVVSAMAHCHSLNIVHNDIKPGNIVFDLLDSSAPIIVDWGSAMLLEENTIVPRTYGTPAYAPPEHHSARTAAEVLKCDVWSIGVTTFVLLTGRLPFTGRSIEEMRKNIQRQELQFPTSPPISGDGMSFISACLRRNISDRISLDEALEMPWLVRASAQSNENIMSIVSHNFENLASASKLQKLLLNIHLGRLDKSERQKMRYAFEYLDRDRKGFITVDELAGCLQEADGRLTKEQALERASALFEAAGCQTRGMDLKRFARCTVANDVLSVDGMKHVYSELTKVVSNDQGIVESKHIQRLYANTFHRRMSTADGETLKEEFRTSFGQNRVTERIFLQSMGFGQLSPMPGDRLEDLEESSADEFEEDAFAEYVLDSTEDVKEDVAPQLTPRAPIKNVEQALGGTPRVGAAILFPHPSWVESHTSQPCELPKSGHSRSMTR